MLRMTVLGSGSRGNAILIDGTDGAVLVDAGFGPRSLVRRLNAAGRRPEEISALVLTHEHTDHASGAAAACARWGWPLYGSAGTLEALGVGRGTAVSPREARAFTADGPTAISGFLLETTSVPHDARDCRALVFTDIRSGARAGVASAEAALAVSRTQIASAEAQVAQNLHALDRLDVRVKVADANAVLLEVVREIFGHLFRQSGDEYAIAHRHSLIDLLH